MFADDLKAYVIHKNEPQKLASLQKFIDNLSRYANINGLKIQPSKCLSQYLGKGNLKNDYTLENSIIPSQNIVRDLGLQISSDLSFHCHVESIVNRALSRLYLLFKSIKSHDMQFLRKLYIIYVRSILDFASPVFNGLTKSDHSLIEKVQKRATYLIVKRYFYATRCKDSVPEYTQRLRILNLDTLRQYRLKSDLILYHKIINGKINVETNAPHLGNPFSITRTNKMGIYPPPSRTLLRKRGFFVRLPLLFIKLPTIVQEVKDNKVFARLLNDIDLSILSG